MSKIVVSGCSFTADCETLERYRETDYIQLLSVINSRLGNNPITIKHKIPKYNSWPNVLSEQLNREVVNLGIGGAGNFSICKRAQDYIFNNHKDVKICIIALSDWRRLSDTLFRTPAVEQKSFDVYKLNKQITKEQKHFFNSDLIYNTLRSIYELQTVCKKFKIPCVIFQMLEMVGWNPRIDDIPFLPSYLIKNPYFSLIDNNYLVGWPFIYILSGYSFLTEYILKDSKKYQIGIAPLLNKKEMKIEYLWDSHPNQEGHNLICKKVIEQLKKFKLI